MADLTGKGAALEYEQIATLATVKGLDRIGWDALGQLLFVEFVAGPPGIDRPLPVALTREAATELLHALQTCLAERDSAAGPVQ